MLHRTLPVAIFLILLTASSLHAATISGKITARGGVPVADAELMIPALDKTAKSGQSGAYSIPDLPAGRYAMNVFKEGMPARLLRIDLRAGDQQLDIHLDLVNLRSETIVISGNRPTDEADIAQAVTVIEGAKLNQLRGQSLVQTVEDTPGMANLSTGNFVGKPVIRGMPSYRSLLLVDGLREESQQFGSEHGPNVDLMDIDKIEIVRGPGSLLYGSDALGGVMNIITPELPSTANGSKTLSARLIGNAFSNNPGGAGAVSLWGATGPMGYRGSFSYRKAGNTMTPDGVIPNSSHENLNGSTLVGTTGKWGLLSLRFAHFDAQLNLPEQTSDATTGRLFADPTATSYQKVGHDRLHLESVIRSEVAKFEIGVVYQQNRRREFASATTADPRLFLVLDTLNTEIKIHHAPLGPLLGTIGLSHINQRNQTLGTESLIPGYQSNSYGAYLFEELRFDAFSLLGGIRTDLRVLEVNDNTSLAVAKQVVESSATTGSVGAVWRFIKDWSYYANLGRGFRAPTAFELFSSGVHEGAGIFEIGNNALQSETTLTADTGIKLRKKTIRAELNAYANRIDNYIYSVPTGATFNDSETGSQFPEYRNTQGRALIYGGEFDMEYSPLRWLAVAGGVDMIQGRNESLNEPLALIPANRYRIGFTLSTNRIGPVLNPYLNLKSRYVARKTEISSQERLLYSGFADYTVLSASIGGDFAVAGDMWNWTIGADNLLNQRYVDYLNRQKLFALNPGINVYFKMTATLGLWD
jgi:iron complex outermembrane recepter protein